MLVENFRPGTMDKLGYGWETLHARHPRLVMTSVSGFGQTGPYSGFPAYDMVVQAMSGMMSVTGHPDAGPCRVGVSIGDLGAGLYAVIGTQAALMRRSRTGQGERVDVSMLDCQVALLENPVARLGALGSVPGPIGTRHPSMAPFDVFAAQDGWFVIAVGSDALFRKLCGLLQLPELAEDARFAGNALRCEHQAELKAALQARLRDSPRAHWLGLLTDNGIPAGSTTAWPTSSSTPRCASAACWPRCRPQRPDAARGGQSLAGLARPAPGAQAAACAGRGPRAHPARAVRGAAFANP